MLLALVSPVLAGLLVNEVVYDPSGSDDGLEWIELCNSGSSSIDLTGYQIENAGSSWTEVYTFASGSLVPGAYLIVGYGSSTHPGSFSPNIQNGGETDGIRVKDAGGTVLDTVLYDDPNDNGLAEDSGAVPSAGAPAATSGKSFGRWPDCADTNVSATDFVLYTPSDVTPGATNADPGGGDTGGGSDTGTSSDADCTGASGVKINEVLYTTGDEYIELFNAGSTTVDLSGWELAYGTRPSSTDEYSIPAGATLAPGAFWVVGSAGASYKDVEHNLADMGNASNTDGVLLSCAGARVDSVLYASPNDDGWTDDSGATATSLAPKPGSGESIARVEDGVDTDQCGVDFVADAPSPGISNTAAPVGDADCAGADGVKINELVYTTEAEWIELFNAGSAPVNLDAWVLQFGTSSYNKEYEIEGLSLAAGDYLLLGTVDGADVATRLDFGNASDTDAVRITCNGEAVDTLLYGDGNDNGWTDDSGEVADSFAPKHGEGESIARGSDGYDTDECGVDFVLSASPTPGAANPYTPPPVCQSGLDAIVKINEFIYNPEGSDSGNEWVELTNTGDAAVRLDGWMIEAAGSDWADKFTFPTGAELGPGAYLLVGGEDVGGDYIADKLSIDNASSGAGGLRIVDCEGAIIDTVLYGGDIEDPITGDGGSMEVVPETGEGASLGRYPNGVDTNQAADWHPYGDPTPGAANTDPGADPGDDGKDKDGPGCGGNPPPPGGSGCTTALPFGGMEVGLAALALLRRRRR